LFPIQIETFSAVYEGRDVLASDRTGSGKTIAYSLPII
jgi:ATP-dependent RNA helicase DDX21